MGALTEDLPKPLLPVAGRPMLEHIVERLEQAGVVEILMVVGYRRETIERCFRDRVRFVTQEVAEGTAAAVRLGESFVGGEPFLLTFGDIICAASNYRDICGTQQQHGAAAVLGVKRVDDPWQGAAVYADDDRVVSRIIEKPVRGTSTTHWNSAGLYAFQPVVFEEIERLPKSPRGEYEITGAIELMIERGLPVRMFEMTGAWRDVGRQEDLDAAPGVIDASR
jgi:dTDP-glucose pyrophosphorylase